MIEIKIPEDSGMIRATIQYLSELDAKMTGGGLFSHTSAPIEAQFEEDSMPSVELDADGKEWDERIHASTRTKTQDGRWKMKRGKPDTIPTTTNESTPPPPVEPIIEEATPPLPPPAGPTAKVWTFVTLVEAITANKIPLEKAQGVAANWGVPRFPMLNTEQYAPLCANIAADLGLE